MFLGTRRRRAAVAVSCLAVAVTTAVAGADSRAAAPPRPIVYVNAYGTYAVRPDGTSWRQLNDCTLTPVAGNGRLLVGGFSYVPDREAPLVIMPADRQIDVDCDSGPRTPPVLRYRLRVRGSGATSWSTLAWSPDGRHILAVGRFGEGSGSRDRLVVFNANGAGYHVVGPTLDGISSSVTDATWSPRGDRIAFGRGFESSDCPEFVETKTIGVACARAELVVTKANGSDARSLYRPPQIEASQRDDLPAGSALRSLPSPLFAPFGWHGDRIFFTVYDDRDGSQRIASISEDGTGLRYLTRGGELQRPALSPDGRQIAVIWSPPGKASGLYLLGSAGSPVRKMTLRQPLTSSTCGGSRKTCTAENIGFGSVTW